MSDSRTFLQRIRGIQESDLIKKNIPSVDDDWFRDTVAKSARDKSILTPNQDTFLGSFDIQTPTQGYARKISSGIPRDVIAMLRAYSNNSIISAIINTRVNQVTNYAKPAKASQDGIGYRVRTLDNTQPTRVQQSKIDFCMRFLKNMGKDYDPNRDDFSSFLRKLTHDSLIYDQVPIERVWDENGNLDHINLVDPTSFVFLTNPDRSRKKTGTIYAQVFNNKIFRRFTSKEMSVFIRNKSSDLTTYGYGHSELESALREVMAQENAESFNDRFFTSGGTVRGILNLKTSSQTSRTSLEAFRKAWRSALSGVAGSYKIPMVTADDIKFVSLSPDAQDMQFEKWFNYLVNSICAIYCIDPSEIGMTNRGGATGTKSNSLNESNGKDKVSISKDKGLSPLLSLIANFISTEIIQRLLGCSNYVFEFVGGDIENRIKEVSLDEQKVRSIYTINEVRESRGLDSLGKKGDTILNGSYIQAVGQQQQQKIVQFQQQQQLVQQLDIYLQEEVMQPEAPNLNGVSYQDVQAGMNGKPSDPSGKENQEGVGKDGQVKNIENTNSAGQGGKNHKK